MVHSGEVREGLGSARNSNNGGSNVSIGMVIALGVIAAIIAFCLPIGK